LISFLLGYPFLLVGFHHVCLAEFFFLVSNFVQSACNISSFGFYVLFLLGLQPGTHSLLITFKYWQCSAITDLHTFQFAVAHALGFFVSPSHLLATGLNTETIRVSLDYALQGLHINRVFRSHFRPSRNFPWLSPLENSELYCKTCYS
jgi:hypothetical protein